MDEREIDLLELAKKLKKHLFSILCLAVIFAALSYAASVFIITPKYEATTTMIVSNSKNEDNNQNGDVELSQINANRALVSTYSEIVKSKGVADKVINNLKLDTDYEEFSQKVSIEPVKDTQIISVKVVDTVPERAMDIANATSMVFKDSITKIMKVDNVQILDKANDKINGMGIKSVRSSANSTSFMFNSSLINPVKSPIVCLNDPSTIIFSRG